MGLEEVRILQMLKFQGGEAPSTFVPSIVPKRRRAVADSPLGKHDITTMSVTINTIGPDRILLDAV